MFLVGSQFWKHVFLVGSKGAFRAHQEHMLLELRAHQKHVLLELRAQQTAHFEPKVVILAILIRTTVYKINSLKFKYYIHIFLLWYRRKIYYVIIPLMQFLFFSIRIRGPPDCLFDTFICNSCIDQVRFILSCITKHFLWV